MFTKARVPVAALLLATLIAIGHVPRAFADEDDPPGRIARANFVEGSVSFQPAGEDDWLTVVPNRPLTTGDNLWTDRDSRDELHIGSTILRMGPETSLSFLDLGDRAAQLRLVQGSLFIRVRHLDDDDDYEVDTPNLAFMVRRPGQYRIDVDPDGDITTITAWNGRGEAIGGGYSYDVVAGQRARFQGRDELNHDIEGIGGRDPFDSWAFDRDDREDHFRSRDYVSEEMTGYEDLDEYGRWNYVAGYGNVWQPTSVPEGWAPYRYGHWTWVDPWGWTWVEDEPWGFAPFHYGRWASGPGGWFWVPGPVVVRPVYTPALVAFVGGNAFGDGPSVGWFPLAPGEVYVPSYRVSERYVNQVNVTNTVVNVTRVTTVYRTYASNPNDVRVNYANQRVNNAVTVVNRDTFVNARPVVKNVVRVDEHQLAQAPVAREVDARPGRPSVLGTGAPARVHPPVTIERRQVVASHTPAPPRPGVESRPLPPTKVETARPAPAPEQRQATQAPEESNAPRPEPNRPPIPSGAYRQPKEARPTTPEADRAPRPEPVRPPQPASEARPAPAEERNVERNSPHPTPPQNTAREQQQWSHPLARPAPPAREDSQQQHAQQEEQKFHNWQQQQQHSEPAPKAAPPPKAAGPKPKEPSRPDDKRNRPE